MSDQPRRPVRLAVIDVSKIGPAIITAEELARDLGIHPPLPLAPVAAACLDAEPRQTATTRAILQQEASTSHNDKNPSSFQAVASALTSRQAAATPMMLHPRPSTTQPTKSQQAKPFTFTRRLSAPTFKPTIFGAAKKEQQQQQQQQQNKPAPWQMLEERQSSIGTKSSLQQQLSRKRVAEAALLDPKRLAILPPPKSLAHSHEMVPTTSSARDHGSNSRPDLQDPFKSASGLLSVAPDSMTSGGVPTAAAGKGDNDRQHSTTAFALFKNDSQQRPAPMDLDKETTPMARVRQAVHAFTRIVNAHGQGSDAQKENLIANFAPNAMRPPTKKKAMHDQPQRLPIRKRPLKQSPKTASFEKYEKHLVPAGNDMQLDPLNLAGQQVESLPSNAEVKVDVKENALQSLSRAEQNQLRGKHKWETMFQGLVKYHKQYGTFAPPMGHLVDGGSLQIWVKRQRAHYRTYYGDEMTTSMKKRIELLKSIGFDFDPNNIMKQRIKTSLSAEINDGTVSVRLFVNGSEYERGILARIHDKTIYVRLVVDGIDYKRDVFASDTSVGTDLVRMSRLVTESGGSATSAQMTIHDAGEIAHLLLEDVFEVNQTGATPDADNGTVGDGAYNGFSTDSREKDAHVQPQCQAENETTAMLQPARPQIALSIKAMPPASSFASAVGAPTHLMPRLAHRLWLPVTFASALCPRYEHTGTCADCVTCQFIHVQQPWKSRFRSIWCAMEPVTKRIDSRFDSHIKVFKAADAYGQLWFTAVYSTVDSERKEHGSHAKFIIFAEGDSAQPSSDGRSWYASKHEALTAIRKTVLVTFWAITSLPNAELDTDRWQSTFDAQYVAKQEVHNSNLIRSTETILSKSIGNYTFGMDAMYHEDLPKCD